MSYITIICDDTTQSVEDLKDHWRTLISVVDPIVEKNEGSNAVVSNTRHSNTRNYTDGHGQNPKTTNPKTKSPKTRTRHPMTLNPQSRNTSFSIPVLIRLRRSLKDRPKFQCSSLVAITAQFTISPSRFYSHLRQLPLMQNRYLLLHGRFVSSILELASLEFLILRTQILRFERMSLSRYIYYFFPAETREFQPQ